MENPLKIANTLHQFPREPRAANLSRPLIHDNPRIVAPRKWFQRRLLNNHRDN